MLGLLSPCQKSITDSGDTDSAQFGQHSLRSMTLATMGSLQLFSHIVFLTDKFFCTWILLDLRNNLGMVHCCYGCCSDIYTILPPLFTIETRQSIRKTLIWLLTIEVDALTFVFLFFFSFFAFSCMRNTSGSNGNGYHVLSRQPDAGPSRQMSASKL